ncbi:dioxygenase [Neisseria dumasiana]|uniref:6-chlorohydroxyquinol-1,2-dioxygenase n=1 Tax=Neisseria dumasiana TaxID=1931275 RepID=A0ABX3WQC9_9NEIS|nr:dioxygenase [Neisseria dumasiana]OSI14577.1 6-chlorohydroxyquinol-1,2-dioxygenase [Neisseria dumasiana]OSI36681.1 6-chlorohydroxyquinol-1,2-dioxygenase [Neisseria dumasiana]UOO85287.1 hypothetical protein LVJ88_04710 [Neisseria dumasiana]
MNLTEQVIRSFQNIENERHRFLITTFIKKLHEYVRETEPSEQEWEQAIRFLTDTGKLCHEQRQEYILLSDVLGVSMLIDQILHEKNEVQTPSTVFGPFFIDNMPIRPFGSSIISDDAAAPPLLVRGKITDIEGNPVAGARIDVWQTAENGMYSGQDPHQSTDNLRGVFLSQEDGSYAFQTILPVSYPIPDDGTVGKLMAYAKRSVWRPAHIHFKIEADGFQGLVTHLFLEGDEYLQNDAVFGVKDRLIVRYSEEKADDTSRERYGLNTDYRLIEYDFILTGDESRER